MAHRRTASSASTASDKEDYAAMRAVSTSPLLRLQETFQTSSSERTSTQARSRILTVGFLALLAAFALVSAYKGHKSIESAVQDASRSDSSSCGDDPWSRPGYISYGKQVTDIRWIPYQFLDNLVFPVDAARLNPESAAQVNTSGSDALPRTVRDRLPVEYSKLFQSTEARRANAQLSFMRNKHVVVLGSSLDREMVKMFCHDHQGAQRFYQHHRYMYCHFQDFNFTISSWMHFGLHQSDWFHGDDNATDPTVGTQIEARLDNLFVPLAERYGNPDLLVFTSGLWDLEYIRRLRKKRTQGLEQAFQPIPFDDLRWHRARLVQVFEHLNAVFPGTSLMYRTTTSPRQKRQEDDEEMIGVYQLNESAKALMASLKVPLFNWSELICGNHEYHDMLHYETESRPNWLYGEMLLWHLKQASTRPLDYTCLANR